MCGMGVCYGQGWRLARCIRERESKCVCVCVCVCVLCIKACLSGCALEIKEHGGNVWIELPGLTPENWAVFSKFP